MDLLRWILLGIGLVILLGIYLAGKLRAARAKRRLWEDTELGEGVVIDRRGSPLHGDAEPVDQELADLGSRMTIGDDEPAPTAHAWAEVSPPMATATVETAAAPAAKPQAPVMEPPTARPEPARARQASAEPAVAVEEKIVAVYLIAPPQAPFHGPDVLAAARAASLEHGDMRIFHRLQAGDDPRPVFSMANSVEPGWFDIEAMDEFETPGLALFLQLPGPLDGVTALDALLAAAQIMQRQLGGELRDAQRSVLTKQTMAHLREDMQEYARRQRLVQAKPH
jgi:cell division protein ZipA